ncbi:MAG: cytochrome c oxidase subunit 4 [Candidatus Nanopelagicales bacterium]|nr:cytochrome c oxidase subunit 4 [Actinomycetota bacterium]MDB9921218.1 cytochrome c oxidase subunit 4 [Actinomycetota bacterium]
MRIEGALFGMGFIFYAFLAGIYWYFSRDEVGTTALALTGALAFLISFYALYTSKRVYPRPEDRLDAQVDEADPEYGFYSPHSWWPLAVGVSVLALVFGLIFAVWLIVLGVAALMFAVIGWLFEYYRGEFAH